jgi:hypothetical protein
MQALPMLRDGDLQQWPVDDLALPERGEAADGQGKSASAAGSEQSASGGLAGGFRMSKKRFASGPL